MKKNIQLGMTSGNLVFAYPAVVSPVQKEEGKPETEYRVLVLMDKTECATDIAALNAALAEVYSGSIADTWGNQQPSGFKNPLHDGDVEKPNNPLYANKMYFNAKSGVEYPPALGAWDPNIQQVVNVDRMSPAARETFYSGCKGALSLNISAYNTAGQKGIGIYMNGILKVKDGVRLSGAETDPAKLFAGVNFGGNAIGTPAFGQPNFAQAQPMQQAPNFAQAQPMQQAPNFAQAQPMQQAPNQPQFGQQAQPQGMPQQGIVPGMMPGGQAQIPAYNPADQTSPFKMPM